MRNLKYTISFYLFIFICLPLSIKADDIYTPMLTEEAVWTQAKNGGFWQPSLTFDYKKYALRGTVEIEGVVYQKMYVTNNAPDFDPCKASLAYAMREEDKKIWLYVPLLEQEILYIDFGLEVGDTATIVHASNFYEALTDVWTVTAKDSILINGEYRDRLRVMSSRFFSGTLDRRNRGKFWYS